MKVRRLIFEDFDHVWEKVQLLLTPTTLTTAPSYKEFIQKTNRDQCAIQDYCTQPANMAGKKKQLSIEYFIYLFTITGVPAITIPTTLSKQGMPIGLQIIGRHLSEPMLLALAKYIEKLVQFPHLT